MPPKSVKDTEILYSFDGYTYTPCPEVTNVLNSLVSESEYKLGFVYKPITLTCQFAIEHSKMSRKVFKKWCMAHHLSRNQAELLCKMIGAFRGKVSYQRIYVLNRFAPTGDMIFANIYYEGVIL